MYGCMITCKTMEDVAKQLGLSRVTVSSVLNDKAKKRNISLATVKRVTEYVEKIGFVPRKFAKQLRSTETTAGILYSGMLYSHLVDAFNKFCHNEFGQHGHLELVITPHNNIVNGIRELISRGVSRLIWIQTDTPEIEFTEGNTIMNLLKGVKTVIYNYRPDHGEWDQRLNVANIATVGIDRINGFTILAKELCKTGHSSAVLAWDYTNNKVGMKYCNPFIKEGFEIYHFSPADASLLIDEQAKIFAKEFIKLRNGITVDVVCFLNDELAGNFMKHISTMGIKIPEDVSITGFDGREFAGALLVPLTTLEVQVEEMTVYTKRFFEEKQIPAQVMITPKLILRESHRRSATGM